MMEQMMEIYSELPMVFPKDESMEQKLDKELVIMLGDRKVELTECKLAKRLERMMASEKVSR